MSEFFRWLADRRMLGVSISWAFGGPKDKKKEKARWIWRESFKEEQHGEQKGEARQKDDAEKS